MVKTIIIVGDETNESKVIITDESVTINFSNNKHLWSNSDQSKAIENTIRISNPDKEIDEVNTRLSAVESSITQIRGGMN